MQWRPLVIPEPRKALVLASSSTYRRGLLEGLGLAVDSCAPAFDEGAFERGSRSPGELALALAQGKAESVRKLRPGSWLLAGDQLLDLDGQIFGKPGTVDRAVEQLLALSGKTHRLVTALVLMDADSGRSAQRLMVHNMEMRALSEATLRDYVLRDVPIDCAGSYKIEGLGTAMFKSIEGGDHTAIVGLPVTSLVSLLAEARSWPLSADV